MTDAPEGSSELGARIRALRIDHDWTMRRLAETADVVPSFISMLEAGKISSPSVMHLYRVALALGVSVEYLIGVDGGSTKARARQRSAHSRARLVGHVLDVLARARAPVVYVHEHAGGPTSAVVVSADAWNALLARLEVSPDAIDLVAEGVHYGPGMSAVAEVES